MNPEERAARLAIELQPSIDARIRRDMLDAKTDRQIDLLEQILVELKVRP